MSRDPSIHHVGPPRNLTGRSLGWQLAEEETEVQRGRRLALVPSEPGHMRLEPRSVLGNLCREAALPGRLCLHNTGSHLQGLAWGRCGAAAREGLSPGPRAIQDRGGLA